MKPYELSTLEGLPKQAWLFARSERDRFHGIAAKWKRDNPNATPVQEMLFESLLRCHLWEQRLVDSRQYFSGEPTDYKQIADKTPDVSSEDLNRKATEFEKYMPLIQRWKVEYLKLALANKIEITGDFDLATLVQSYQQHTHGEGSNLNSERGNRVSPSADR